MLDRLSDYKFTIPESGVIVNGGIMPARDVAGDGSWKVLRGEDPCFLSEAARRMRVFRHYTGSKDEQPRPAYANVTKAVEAAPLGYIRSEVADAAGSPDLGDGNYAMPFSPSMRQGNIIQLKADTAQASITWKEVINGTFYNTPLHGVTFLQPSFSSHLTGDAIRQLFYNHRQMGSVFSTGPSKFRWARTPAHIINTYDSETGTTVTSTERYEGESGWESVYQSANMYWPPNTPRQEFREWEIQQILPADFQTGDTATALSVLADAREAVSATALFAVEGQRLTRNGNAYTQFCIPRACHLDPNGIVTLDAPLTAANVLNLVSSAMGWTATVESRVTKRVTVEPGVSVLLFSDPALDTGAIPWRWTPPS